ncbi:hypothetical protein BQ8769_103 [Escherichia coli]|uniref:Uncharacterized protein n=1 Tax=Escherichia coli TaxID=562 RepID=A0A1W1EMA3_ECOLX|nr:hypothetical protein BQ8769_103 [Escherichia coli]
MKHLCIFRESCRVQCNNISPKVRQRAIRIVLENQDEYDSQ